MATDLGLGVSVSGRDNGTVKTLRDVGAAAEAAKKSATSLNTATTAQAAQQVKTTQQVTAALEKQRRETEAVAKATKTVNAGGGSKTGTTGAFSKAAGSATGNAAVPGAKQDKNGRWRDAKGQFLTGDELAAASGGAASGGAAGGKGGASDGFFGSSEKAQGRRKDAGQEMQSSLAGAATAFSAFGAAGLLGMGMAADATAEFETAVSKVQTIASSAQFPLEKLQSIGFGMQSAYGGTLTDQMQALYNAIGSGADKASDATELMNQSNKLAIGGLTTVDKAMYGLVGTANAYGIAYSQAGTVADAFFAAVKLGGSDMSVDTLASKLSGVTPIASAMGVSMNELLASLARLTAVGVPTAEAVTGMKATIEGIIRPTADSAKEAKRLGVEFNQAALKSKGILGVLRDVQGSTKFNSESFKKLFSSTEALNAALALSANGGESFAGMLDEMNHATGSADAAFMKMAGTSKFAGAMLKANMEQALVKIGSAVLAVSGPVIGFANKLLVAFNSLPPFVGQAVGGLILFASVASLGMGAALALAAGITAVALAGEAVLIGVGVAVVAVGVLSGALLGLGAVIGGAYAVYSANLGGIGTLVDGIAAKVKLAYEGIRAALSGGISGGLLDELGKGSNDKVFAFVQTVVGGVNIAKRAFEGLKNGFDVTMAQLAPTFEQVSIAARAFFDLFSIGAPKTGAAFSAMSANASGFGAGIGDTLATLVGWVARGITSVLNFGTAFATGFQKIGIAGGTLEVIGGAVAKVAAAFGSLGAGVSGTNGAVGNSAAILGKFFAVAVNGGLAAIRVFASVVSGVIAVASNIYGVFSGVSTIIGGAVGVVAGIINGDWRQVMGGFYDIGFGAIEALLSVIGVFVTAVGGQLDNMAALFGKDLGIVKGFEAAKTDVLTTFAGAAGKGPKLAGVPGPGGAQASTGPQMVAGLNPDGSRIVAKPAGLGGLGVNAGDAAVPLAGPSSALLGVTGIKPGGPSAGPVAPGVGAAPGTGGAADMAAFMKPAPPPPVTVNTTTSVILDGQKVGEAVEKYMATSGARGFGATPSAT